MIFFLAISQAQNVRFVTTVYTSLTLCVIIHDVVCEGSDVLDKNSKKSNSLQRSPVLMKLKCDSEKYANRMNMLKKKREKRKKNTLG